METITEVEQLRVSIQGYAGAFHEAAARQHFADRRVVTVPAHTFADVVEQVETGQSDLGLMAIENTLAGSLMANYDLLQTADLRITAEVYLRIRLNLMALPGTDISQLRVVHSHPVALAQCREFFKPWPRIKLIEDADTALSARQVTELQDPTRGAVASATAAELYGLDILAPGIETNKLNHTRFLVLERGRDHRQDAGDKVSLSFATSHESGSLYKVLMVLAAYQVNLTKIQSAPIIGRPFQYRFHVDFLLEGNISLEQALEAIRPLCTELRILGVYAAGEKP
ncbi:prephenate dehydratase domain-containing protein [Neolewinella lacunae]|uniref:prephenate dehydratase n=1 Tax=Neolewinella lacunae TaxID=1517758 RepID=A0A923PJI5_9BACT|nr:prephenate dehydratase domain-containing protein [Neolewinella lacunae]MBC6992881.1 prephenate dehydratase [Neolewinella lacunae]MDN3633755.1 prephenate dehydratase domain-containing protein [Neolewinella lacunae]